VARGVWTLRVKGASCRGKYQRTLNPREVHMRTARNTLPAALLAAAFILAPRVASAASPPAAPHVTVGADVKQLIFDWDAATGATYYRLMVRIGSGAYKPLIDNIPASTTQVKLSIAAHLLPWTLTRYAIAACNASGCTNSVAISPQNLMLESIGYFKASNTDVNDQFGVAVALSDDGRTLAVAALAESSNATGVNGNQADNSSVYSGAVYVFRRVASGWRQEAYLKAGVNQPLEFFGSSDPRNKSLAINANGTLLAVGARGLDTPGIGDAGVVYIYQKSSTGLWSLAATLNPPAPQQLEGFGVSIDMSLDGRTLKVDSAAPFDDFGPEFGGTRYSTHIFVRVGTTWQHTVTFVPDDDEFCTRVRLSGDGNTLLSDCYAPFTAVLRLLTRKRIGDTWTLVSDQQLESSPFGNLAVDFDASTMAREDAIGRTVSVYQWDGASWLRETNFPLPPDAAPSRTFGPLALNRAGNLLAVAEQNALENGAGVAPTSMPGSASRGAVYMWRRDDRTATWGLRSVVKSPNPGVGDGFGAWIALCGTGNALAVGANGEDSNARGVDGDRTNNNASAAGAAYLY
jgi:hypothetical protein